MSIRFVTCNMFKRLNAAESQHLVNKTAAFADVIVWQEVTRDVHKQTLKALDPKVWATYFSDRSKVGGLAISWRIDKLEVQREGKTHRVVPGVPLDPNRGFISIVLRERKNGTVWPCIGAHMTHQAWTSHPERRARWTIQAYRLRMKTRRMTINHGRCLGGADVNRHHWAPKGTVPSWPNEGTFGKAKYDVTWCRGDAEPVGESTAIHTPSDHDAVLTRYRRRS